MANFAAQGTVGAPFPVHIERGKIIEFAAATHSGNPAYRQEQPVVPPTFLTTQMFWQEWAGPGANPWHHVELDQRRGMHAEQEYVFHGPPPRAGTALTARSRIAEIYQKQGRRGGTLTFAVLVTEFRDAAGRLVAEARMTGVETASPPVETVSLTGEAASSPGVTAGPPAETASSPGVTAGPPAETAGPAGETAGPYGEPAP